MTKMESDLVEFLQWDSHFFNKRIGRVKSHNLHEIDINLVDEWAVKNSMDCIYYLADGNEILSTMTAEGHDFHLMDLRVTYQMDLQKTLFESPEKRLIRQAKSEDLPKIKHMAGEFHSISRFFADEHFDRDLCKKLYQVWIERDFQEVDHYLWVFEQEDQLLGYTSGSVDLVKKTAEIGLVGVDSKWRGQGIGRDLQLGVLCEFQKIGINHVEVVTQGRNPSAMNLYCKSGYRLKSINLWYHKWYI